MFIGTWVDGLVLFGHRPGRAGRIRSMPVIDGKRVAAFATYAIHAGKALDRFARVLDERGATVVRLALLRRDRLEAGIAEFVSCVARHRPRVGLRPGAGPAPSARLGESPCVPRPAEPSSGRWPWSSGWCSSAWPTSVGARTAVLPARADSSSPGVPRPRRRVRPPADRDLAVDRTLARCEPDAPAAQPLAQVAPCGWP